ncbi:MAG: TSUP family transporter, partial [Rhodocyclaceae bacterium]
MDISLASFALLVPLLLGAVLGGVGGLLGIGGGIIAIPVLAMGFGMDQQMAQGTALVMITPNVLLAFWRYRQRHHLPLRTAGLLGLATLLATWPAARLAVQLDSQVLMVCFAVFLL